MKKNIKFTLALVLGILILSFAVLTGFRSIAISNYDSAFPLSKNQEEAIQNFVHEKYAL